MNGKYQSSNGYEEPPSEWVEWRDSKTGIIVSEWQQ